jgi:hypothetical protein
LSKAPPEFLEILLLIRLNDFCQIPFNAACEVMMSDSVPRKYDPWSVVVVVLTLVLFFVSIFVKGFTHELLLETGVFLVSVKLILLGHKNSLASDATAQKLEQITLLLERQNSHLRLVTDLGRPDV